MLAREILLVERLADERFDHSLATDVQLLRGPVQFFQHAGREIDVYSLNRGHHPAVVGEEAGYVFAQIGEACDGFCRHRLAALTCFVHKGAPRIYTPTGCGFPASNCRSTYCKIPPLE